MTLMSKFGTDHATRCLQAERAFLAGCIFDPKQAQAVSDLLSGEYFTNPAFWHLYCCIVEAESSGTDLTIGDLGELAAMADIDVTQSDLWALLDEQWETRGTMVPMLADTLIDLAEQEDQLRYHIRSIRKIVGDSSDRLIEDQLPKRPTGLKMPDRLRRAWRRKHRVRVTV